MLKYDIDIKELILGAWSERELKGKEWRINNKEIVLRDKLYESLSDEQKKIFDEIQEYDDSYIAENEINLIQFVLTFINSIYK